MSDFVIQPYRGRSKESRTSKDLRISYDKEALTSLYTVLHDETLACLSKRIRFQPFPAKLVRCLARDLHLDTKLLVDTLGLPRSIIFRKIKKNENLDPGQVERIIGMQRLLGQVQAMVVESGNAKGFDAGRWLGEWIEQPMPALDGRRPAEYLGDSAGREWISRLLRQIQASAFA